MTTKTKDLIEFETPEIPKRITTKCDFNSWLEEAPYAFSPFPERKSDFSLFEELVKSNSNYIEAPLKEEPEEQLGYNSIEDLNEKFAKLRLMDVSSTSETNFNNICEAEVAEHKNVKEENSPLPTIQISNRYLSESATEDIKDVAANNLDTNSMFTNSDIQNVAFCEGTTFNFTQTLNSSFESGKESLGILPEGYLEGNGRESLGILQVNFDLNKLSPEDLKLPQIFNQESNNSQQIDRLFESGSGLSVSPSFNFDSKMDMTDISKISLFDQHTHTSTNLLNIAFEDSAKFVQRLKEAWNGLPQKYSLNLLQYRPQIKSLQLPAVQEDTDVHERKAKSLGNEEDNVQVNNMENQENDNVFNDSVFIEAAHIASKIADGSIYEDDCDLNSTTPPSLEILEETDQPEVKCDTETVFKKIDQLLPTVNKISPETADKNTSKSEETQAILHNLSAILDKECRDPNAKQQGHDLISSLAVIITKKRLSFSCDRSSLEDSGHSSIDGDLDDQPLDLRMNKSAKGEQVSKPRFSRSLTDGNGSSKAETGKMSESLKNQEESGKMKFKLKKTTEKAAVSKTGPLKAVIPITNMTKASSFRKPTGIPTTPSKIKEQSKLKSRKTSTPIRGLKMKPMAASTPDSESDNSKTRFSPSISLNKKKTDSPLSQDKRSSFSNLKSQKTLNKSSSTPCSVPQASMGRRKSAGDIQASATPVRRNSLGKDNKISAALSKMRDTIINSKLLERPVSLASGLDDSGNKIERVGLKENRLGLMYGGLLKPKKAMAGKENVGR